MSVACQVLRSLALEGNRHMFRLWVHGKFVHLGVYVSPDVVIFVFSCDLIRGVFLMIAVLQIGNQ